MNRSVSAREFLHNFAALEKQLPPGEGVVVTRRGEPIGTFVKQGPKTNVAMPDFKKDASGPGFTTMDGDLLLARMLQDEELS
jgi:antitoxin (DNA-binding transcriptional repressor) of toxin-antitoxin stability system